MAPTVSRMIFVLAALLLPIAVIVTSKVPAVLIVILALAVLVLRRPRDWRSSLLYLVVFGLLIAWAMASAIWSLEPTYSFQRAVRLALTIGCGLVLCIAALEMEPEDRSRAATAVCIGLFLGVAIALLDGLWWQIPHALIAGENAQRPLLLTHLPASCVFAVLLFPAMAVLIMRRWFVAAGALAILTVTSVIVSGTTAALLATVAAAAVFAVVRIGGAVVLRTLAAAVPILFLTMPLLLEWSDLPRRATDVGVTLGVSTGHRLVVWRFVSERSAERPILGWGFHSSRMVPGSDATIGSDTGYDDILAASELSPEAGAEIMPLHPHNTTLQVRLELGLVGVLLYAVIYLLILRGVLRLTDDRTARAGAAAGIMAAFVIGQISFSAWQTWWVATQFWTAALVVATLAMDSSGSKRCRPESLSRTTPIARVRAFR